MQELATGGTTAQGGGGNMPSRFTQREDCNAICKQRVAQGCATISNEGWCGTECKSFLTPDYDSCAVAVDPYFKCLLSGDVCAEAPCATERANADKVCSRPGTPKRDLDIGYDDRPIAELSFAEKCGRVCSLQAKGNCLLVSESDCLLFCSALGSGTPACVQALERTMTCQINGGAEGACKPAQCSAEFEAQNAACN